MLFLDLGCYFFVVANLGIQESKQVISTVIHFHRLIYVRWISIRISIFKAIEYLIYQCNANWNGGFLTFLTDTNLPVMQSARWFLCRICCVRLSKISVELM